MKRLIGCLSVMVAAAAYGDLPPVTATPLPESGGFISSATPGPDGGVWFLDADKNLVGRTSASSGNASTFPVPTANAGLRSIVVGPDSNLWFVESNANKLGKITSGGAITEYPITGGLLIFSAELASGSDGNLWLFAQSGPKGVLVRFTTAGAQQASITMPGNPSNVKLAQGPGATIWFHDRGSNTVGFVSASGSIQSFAFKTAETAGGFFSAGGLTAGPDGNEWVAHSASVARVTPAGTITEYAVPGASFIAGVAAGADGNIWFTDHQNAKLGRLIVSSATDQGTATIDVGSAGLKSPAALYPVTGATGAARIVPLDDCPKIPAAEFVETSDDTPPPHVARLTVSSSAATCADIGLNFGPSFTTRQGLGFFQHLVVSGGPDTAVVTLTYAFTHHPIISYAALRDGTCTIGGSTAVCKVVLSKGSAAFGTIGFRSLNGDFGVSGTLFVTSDQPDPNPQNNQPIPFAYDFSFVTSGNQNPINTDPPARRHP